MNRAKINFILNSKVSKGELHVSSKNFYDHMNKVFLYSLLFLFVVVTGCKEDDEDQCCDPTNPECPNYDPCINESPVTAEFKIYDDVFSGGPNADQWFEDDKIYRGRIKFEAVEDSANYIWYLGAETITGTEFKEVIKNTGDLLPGTYTAALVVDKEPNTFCFPEDDGRDSIFKTFDIVGVCDLMIMNKFKGVFESAPQDSVIIEMYPWEFLPGNTIRVPSCEPNADVAYVNFANDGDTIFDGSAGGILNRYFERFSVDPFIPVGYLEVSEDGTCIAEYEMYDELRVFNGRIIE